MNSSPCHFADQLHLCVQIDVGHNGLGQAASLQLIAAMKGKSLVSIGMVDCGLKLEGAKAVAELISVTASVTSVRSPAYSRAVPALRPVPLPTPS